MKSLLLLYFMVLSTGLLAQIPTQTCDTIILRNKRAAAVRIDSITSTRCIIKSVTTVQNI